MTKNLFIVLLIGMTVLGFREMSYAAMCGDKSCDAHSGQIEGQEIKPVDVGNKICPVSGEKIDEKTKATYEYQGKIYNFCCPMCIDEFKKNPDKYIEKVKKELQAGM